MSLCIKLCGVTEGTSCHPCCLLNQVIISLTSSAASPSLSVLLIMELLFTPASFWGAALVSKPTQWHILNNLVLGGLNTVSSSPAETGTDSCEYSARRLIWRETVGWLRVVGCRGSRGLEASLTGPVSASQLYPLLVS